MLQLPHIGNVALLALAGLGLLLRAPRAH